ncbi:MAG: hypothetical protein JJ896_12420 [Rhodothermales bacterium]|nr:hypothetical protein [Rhodothermales bacterium]MBO6780450.1 hypothetical protein [Rhodothermales bacterium]
MHGNKLYLALHKTGEAFHVLLDAVQEVIRLKGPFASIDTSCPTVRLRGRTVRLLAPAHDVDTLIVFEREQGLVALPVRYAGPQPLDGSRELPSKHLQAS